MHPDSNDNSTDSDETAPGTREPPTFAKVDRSQFNGKTRYWKTAENCLDITLSQEQREILEAVAEHRYTYIEGANGFGKTYGLLALALGYWLRHYPVSVMVTSGTYGKLKRTFCDPLSHIHAEAGLDEISTWKWSPNPHIDVHGKPNWQFEVASPEDAGELEGVHNTWTLAIIEEADKDAVNDDVIDSMESLITDERDRMVVVANPPKDELNVVNELRQDPKYHNLNFSTFDSHNVKVEIGERRADEIPGLATIRKLKDDWESYNAEPWPGVEQARYAHVRSHPHYRNDLDTRWYRRRGGVIPPDTAGEHRPLYISDVERAWDREPPSDQVSAHPTAVGVDVASSADSTVMATVHNQEVRIPYAERGTHHGEQRRRIWGQLDEWGHNPTIAIDAIGVGQALADETRERYPNAYDYKANRDCCDIDTYKDCWTEALGLAGEWFKAGGSIPHTAEGCTPRDQQSLKEQFEVAARSITYETKYYKSRDTDVLVASSRDDVKERLGHSPDHLDAALMAIWAHMVENPNVTQKDTVTRVFRI